MELIHTQLNGLKLLKSFNPTDERGKFVKLYNQTLFDNLDLPFTIKEAYYSVSKKDVIRGMHFQVPPKAHKKLVFVSSGRILDVVLDIRYDSPTFGQVFEVELDAIQNWALFIPEGFAHGFHALREGVVVNYIQSSEHSPEHDKGILWNSFSFDWNIETPIVSERDLQLDSFDFYKEQHIEW